MDEWLRLIPEELIQAWSICTPVMLHTQLNVHLDEKKNGAKKFLHTFQKLKTNNERIDLIHERLEKYKLLDDKFHVDTKSDSIAKHCKREGDMCFATGNFGKAFRCYTKMLMHASSPELINTAYMNRSAALFKLKLYNECITDIDRALAGNCHEHLKRTLTTRRAKALELGKKSKSNPKPYEEPPQIPTTQRNPALNCASNCIEVKNDLKQRRRVVAARDIKVGEVVAVETPFCAIIGNGAVPYHCHECFELCYTLIPCNNCTYTLYCSDTCRQIAYSKFHKDECPILKSLKYLVGLGDTEFLVAVKMAFLNQDEQADEVLKFASEVDDKNYCDDLLMASIVAAYMYDLVKKHTQKFKGENVEQMERTFKDSILNYLRISVIQTTRVLEFCPKNDRDEDEHETIAFAIYPISGLFRHSCCPNIYANHHGLKQVMRALRTIKKGQECFVTYGPHYINNPKEQRQDRLSAIYHFTCKCRACREDWPQGGLEPLAIVDSVNSVEDIMCLYQLSNANVESAKRVVSKYVQEINHLEQFEPRRDLVANHELLLHCYDFLGNKRMIF